MSSSMLFLCSSVVNEKNVKFDAGGSVRQGTVYRCGYSGAVLEEEESESVPSAQALAFPAVVDGCDEPWFISEIRTANSCARNLLD